MKYLIFIVLLISSCSVPSNDIRFSGDHTTEAIRGMWHICYMTHRQVNRSAPELYLWKLCDCVIDKSREKYKSTDYDKQVGDNLTKFFKNANLECALEIKNVKADVPQLKTL